MSASLSTTTESKFGHNLKREQDSEIRIKEHAMFDLQFVDMSFGNVQIWSPSPTPPTNQRFVVFCVVFHFFLGAFEIDIVYFVFFLEERRGHWYPIFFRCKTLMLLCVFFFWRLCSCVFFCFLMNLGRRGVYEIVFSITFSWETLLFQRIMRGPDLTKVRVSKMEIPNDESTKLGSRNAPNDESTKMEQFALIFVLYRSKFHYVVPSLGCLLVEFDWFEASRLLQNTRFTFTTSSYNEMSIVLIDFFFQFLIAFRQRYDPRSIVKRFQREIVYSVGFGTTNRQDLLLVQFWGLITECFATSVDIGGLWGLTSSFRWFVISTL